jgi:hypothetical protein
MKAVTMIVSRPRILALSPDGGEGIGIGLVVCFNALSRHSSLCLQRSVTASRKRLLTYGLFPRPSEGRGLG